MIIYNKENNYKNDNNKINRVTTITITNYKYGHAHSEHLQGAEHASCCDDVSFEDRKIPKRQFERTAPRKILSFVLRWTLLGRQNNALINPWPFLLMTPDDRSRLSWLREQVRFFCLILEMVIFYCDEFI